MIASLREARPWRSRAVLVAVAINIVLIALYLWSRGGATVHVRIETEGTEYRAYVDGRQIVSTQIVASGDGRLAISLPAETLSSLPNPTGIDSVRIEDLDTGEVLEDEDFGSTPDGWQARTGEWRSSSGAYTTSRPGFLQMQPIPWGNYAIDVKLKNPTSATLRLTRDEGATTLLRVWPYKRYDSRLTIEREGVDDTNIPGRIMQLDQGETIKSIAAMMLRPYPLALLIVAGGVVLALGLRTRRLETLLGDLGSGITEAANGLVLILVSSALILLWYLNYVIGDAIPHVPDSVAYVFQAKIFASFQLTADPPPLEASFSFFNPPFIHVVDGDWFTQYPFGHPLFLAIGERVGAVWLVPPILGAASLYLIFRLGAHVYGTAVGLVAAFLLFFSPFFQMTASNFMSHNTAVFVLLLCLFLLYRPSKRKTLSMFFAGVALGLLFNMRPLPALAFIPVLGGFMLYELWQEKEAPRQVVKQNLAFIAGGLVMLLAYLGYNQVTTGAFLESPQTLTFGDTSNWVGFGGTHTVARGLQNQQVLLSIMVLVADGWPAAIGLLFAMLPFVLGTRNRWDYFLGAAFLSLAAANIFYRNTAIMHGPRFWYETMPFLMLLSARGAMLLIERASGAGDWLAAQLSWRPEASGRAITGLAVFGLLAGLMASSAHGWMLEQRELWTDIDFTPAQVGQLENFNFTHRKLLDSADEMDLDNALVFVLPCRQWWCYGSVFWANDPGLDGDVVWAQQTETIVDARLVAFFPGRDIYLGNFADGEIRQTSIRELDSIAERRNEESRARP